MTSSILISGFPGNATDREMENFCRFLPGYIASKASFKGSPKVFVRFDAYEAAQAAVSGINGQPFDELDPDVILTSAMARTDLNPPAPGSLVPGRDKLTSMAGQTGFTGAVHGMQNAWPQSDWGAARGGNEYMPPAKRARVEVADAFAGGTDTICVKGWEQGLTAELMLQVFERTPGFVTLQMSKSGKGGGNCFVKFTTPSFASKAIRTAQQAGYEAEMARTSLNIAGSDFHAPAVGKGAKSPLAIKGKSKAPYQAPYQAPHQAAGGEEDTLAIFGLGEKGHTEEELIDLFSATSGFLGLRCSTTGKGGGHCFVKYESARLASKGKEYADENGCETVIAKTSLNLAQATYVPT